MTIRNVTYRSSVQISCACVDDSDVIICLDPTFTIDGAPFIEGVLTTTVKGSDTCGNVLYSYYLEYDDVDLADPSSLIIASDIDSIICKDCLTDYIDWKAVNKGTTANRPTSNLYVGRMYLDTTLDSDGLPIWWNGTKWIRADGSDA